MVKIPEKYSKSRISLSMAGSGNPWDYFIESSKLTLRSLHDGYSLKEIQEMLEITKEELLKRINLLISASLIRKENEKYTPTFLIVDEEETKQTVTHSKKIGRIIADEFKTHLNEIIIEYEKLDISQIHLFDDLSFLLVGSKILDIALLEELAKDKTLLIPAPKRPSPKRPDAQYYFFMVEGPVESLGQYGEDSKDLPFENWNFVTFGKNIINGKYNEPRGKVEKKCDELRENNKLSNPEEYAISLKVPFLSKKDSIKWREFCNKIANRILIKIKEYKEELLKFYSELKTSKYADDSFGEFFCWYFHLAYAWAIDFLTDEKVIKMPPEKYSAIVIYYEDPQGLLVK
ncbi:MAG: hypothetical protein FK733_07010 [Asgard group archaeon]|nr:hypothetical protein [Asgard group archaeon]